jgi:REP element-mobilizing transposase RayT
MARRVSQLEMRLRPAPRWGGSRENAGRKRCPGSGMPHTSREGFSSPLPLHVTIRLLPNLLSLRTKKLVRALERTFASGCDRSSFRLVHYSLLGNHAHLIVEAQDQHALGRGMMAIGSRLALAVNRVMGRKRGRVVADRYHARVLRTPQEVRNALRYVLLNARRHAAASARKALRAMEVVLDPASSAQWFDGWKPPRHSVPGAHDDAAAGRPPPVARARTWLLRVGWRRHGLLDPTDVPG